MNGSNRVAYLGSRMSAMLAETAFAGAGALNANFPRFCNNSGLSGHNNVADIQPSRAHHQKLTSGLLERRCNWTGGRPSRSPSFDAYGQRPLLTFSQAASQAESAQNEKPYPREMNNDLTCTGIVASDRHMMF